MFVVSAGVAHGVIPSAERVFGAVARTNRSAGRTDALRLDLSLRIGDGEPIATGQLVTHPTGLARLELVKTGEFVERHILQGTEHLVARNGRLVEDPRAFLPPLFLLQAGSAVSFEAALRSHGVEVAAIGLAPCGDADCYVVGDPELAPARLPVAPPDLSPPEADAPGPGDEGSEPKPVARAPRGLPRKDESRPATVWIDTADYEIRRLQSAEGVRVVLGPTAVFEKLRVPAWLEIREPRHVPVTLEIQRAAAVNAPANAFGREWLFAAPPPPEAAEGLSLQEP